MSIHECMCIFMAAGVSTCFLKYVLLCTYVNKCNANQAYQLKKNQYVNTSTVKTVNLYNAPCVNVGNEAM